MLNRKRSRVEIPRILALGVTLAAAHLAPAPLGAQAPGTPAHSIGQPPRWQPYLAGLAASGPSAGSGGIGAIGVNRHLTTPVTGTLGVAAEAYAATPSERGAGARVLATSRALSLSAGADWSATDGRVDWLFSYQSAVRRGGILGRGTMLRVDWLPTRDRTLAVGVTAPLWPRAGVTRSRDSDVDFPRVASAPPASRGTLPTAADDALRRLAADADRLRPYISTYSPATERAARALPREGVRAAEASYQRALREAFVAALDGDARSGERVAARARALLLDRVLLPYDRDFGRVRHGTAELRRLTDAARVEFARWIADSAALGPQAAARTRQVHDRWLAVIERVHAALLADSGDSRTVWLPLQLAVAPDEYDEQTEVDSLIARAVGRPFSDRNALTYLRSGDLPLEIARSIYAARDYHVLWTHDFAGRREKTHSLDLIAFEMVADAYLPALTAAVRRYDAEGRLPVFTILIDQYFYEPRVGRLWMSILEDPLRASMRLPRGNGAREAQLRQRQAELRAAVAASARLQRDAAAHGGEGWLRRVVKVHVNVTQPSDFSFRSHHIVPGIPFTPDNVMRDHRKIVFYDLDEADPYRGAMLLMGVGVGEHYASATWEDRGYRLRGPAALEVRAAARRVLRRHGFAEDQVPVPLRAVPGAPAGETTVRAADREDYVGRALQVHNEVGWGAKQSSVARAMLYTLAEPGSVVVVPDPLWLSREWAGLLTGAALRGARVHVIAPAEANAPSPQAPLMALSHDLLSRLLELRVALAPQLAASGGELRIGLFASTVPVTDVEGRKREIREGLARLPWLRAMVPFDTRALAVLTEATTETGADRDATDVARDERPRPPQLHQKTLLVARPGAIAALARQPGWETVLARTMETQSAQTARFAEQLGYVTPAVEEEATRGTDALLRGFEQAVPEAERKRVSFYFAVGTQNQDPRGLMLDGEASMITSGFHAAAGVVDLYFLMARTTWIDTPQQLERLLPAKPFWLRIARVVRPVF